MLKELFEPVEEVHIISSAVEMEKFQSSIIWQDLVKVMKSWKESLAFEYDVLDPEDKVNLSKIQARRQTIDYLMDLPAMLAEDIKMEAQNESRRNEAEGD